MTAIVDVTTVTPPGTVVATIIALPPTSTKGLAENKAIYLDGDQIQVVAITVPSAGATIPDPGPYVVGITATASKCTLENKYPLRLGDQSSLISAVPQIPGSPPVNYPVSFKCVISNAGQSKVSAQ